MTYREFKDYFFQHLHSLYDENELKVIYRELLKHFCGIEPIHQLLENETVIQPQILPLLLNATDRLLLSEPYQYICSSAEFCDLKLLVNKSVLIPRPETEELVRHVISVAQNTRKRPSSILDLCTGSGCIALALKKHFPEAVVRATDSSLAALKVAEYNAQVNELSIEFMQHDLLLQELPFKFAFDCIVSNPPYVTMEDKAKMDKRVLDYEPMGALFAPERDPLAFYRVLKDIVFRFLSPGGFFIFEINEALGEECLSLFRDFDDVFEYTELLIDSYNKYRFICGLKL